MSQTVAISAGQTGSATGDVWDAITLGAHATLDIAAGTQASLFGGLVAPTAAALSVEAGAITFAAGPVAAAVTVSLHGSGSTLLLAASSIGGFAATIASFVPGAIIDISGARITSVGRQTLGTGLYSLVLGTDAGFLGSILIGTSLPSLVIAVPDGSDGTRLINGPYLPSPAAAAAAAADGSANAFTWIGGAPGTWATAADWTTSSGPASRAPGAGDTVRINAGTARMLPVTGSGYALTLSTSGDVILAGTITTGLLLAGTGPVDALVLASNALVLAAAATVRQGDLDVQGGTLIVAGTLTLAGMLDGVAGGDISAGALSMTGGVLRLAGNASMSVGSSVSWAPGILTIGADGYVQGSGTIDSATTLAGTLEVAGLMSVFGPVTGDGLIRLDTGSTLFVTGGVDQATIEFSAGATLELYGDLTGALVSNFGAGDSVELAGSVPGTITWTAATSGGTLDLGSLGAITVALAPGLDPSQVTFSEAADGLGGTTISEVPCFVASTRLRTPTGWIAAGDVRPGCWLATASGAARRATWVGCTSVSASRRFGAPQLDPVCIRAGAFAPGYPAADVTLSPLHGLVLDTIDGVRVVPAIGLQDGDRIVRDRRSYAVDYVHIALKQHDALLAEGMPCKSYLSYGPDPRSQFSRSLGARPTGMTPLAARLDHGYALHALRTLLGLAPPVTIEATLQGSLDEASATAIRGWATPSRSFDVLLRGVPAGRLLCNHWRADLEAAHINHGHAAFVAAIPAARQGERLSLRPEPFQIGPT